MLLLHAHCVQHVKKHCNYVMRCREQSQKSMSIARSCLDSSVSLLRHSMKSLRPPWGPSSQMKAHSLGRRSSRCVRPADKREHTASNAIVNFPRFVFHNMFVKDWQALALTGQYLESYLCQCRQSTLVKHTDAAHLLNFSWVDPLSPDWL